MSAYEEAVNDARFYLENKIQCDADLLAIRRGLTPAQAESAIKQARAELAAKTLLAGQETPLAVARPEPEQTVPDRISESSTLAVLPATVDVAEKFLSELAALPIPNSEEWCKVFTADEYNRFMNQCLIYASVPVALKVEPNWLVYKLVWDAKKDRNDKKPYHPLTGLPTNDPEQGVTFDCALGGAPAFDGLGFYVEPPYVVIDIDHCRDATSGVIEPWALNIIYDLKTYAELSPSGTGVHIWLKGEKPGKACRKGIEIYSTGRFMTVTGRQVVDTFNDVEERDITSIYERMLAGEFRQTKKSKSNKASHSGAAQRKPSTQIIQAGSVLTSKLAVFMTGIITSQKPFIIDDGQGNSLQYESQSEADLALCTLLALEHDLEPAVMDSEFRKSPLYRAKWDRHDYSDSTISKAIESARRLKERSALVAVAKTEKTFDVNAFLYHPHTEMGNAERLVDMFGDHIHYCDRQGLWLLWSGMRWAPAGKSGPLGMMQTVVRRLYEEASKIPEDIIAADNADAKN